MKWQALLLILFTSALCPAAIADAATSTDNSAPQVIIKDYKFIPQEITIKRGQTVTWENREKRQYHSVWFEALGEEEPEYIFPDESYQHEFKKTGTFPYRCGPHPEMIGTVHVK